MRSLDEFYKYIEQQENALRTPPAPKVPQEAAEVLVKPIAKDATVPPPRPVETRYVIRGGVTVLVRTAPEASDAAPNREKMVDVLDAPDETPDVSESAYLPPIIEADDPPQVAPIPTRHKKRYQPPATQPAKVSADAEESLWQQVPRHLQLLVAMAKDSDFVTDPGSVGTYTRAFQESRQQLIERLTDPTLTLEDTARVLGVCPTTVRRYTNRGLLPHYRTPGQQRRFRLSDVMAFWERQQGESSAPENGAELSIHTDASS